MQEVELNLSEFGEWKRFEFPFRNLDFTRLQLIIPTLATNSTIYLDAVQIEQGGEVGDFTNEMLNPTSVVSPNTAPVAINLYVFSDKKQTVPGFNTEFAGNVNAKTIENFALNSDGEPWMSTSKKRYLTKLTRSMTPAEMVEDLTIRDSGDNTPINSSGLGISWLAWIVIGGVVIVELALAVVFWCRNHRKAKV